MDEMTSRKCVRGKGRSRPNSREDGDRLTEECLRAAYRLLKYRQRSENELRIKLSSRFEKIIIDDIIDRLREVHMVDDVAFAKHWRQQREMLNPHSRKMVCLELRRKGIDKELIDRVLYDFDDEENAYRAAIKKANLVLKEGEGDFRRKLGAFLVRRGFSYEVTRRTTNRLWRELS